MAATGLLAVVPAAHAHSLVRKEGSEIAYLSSDAVSLNTLVVTRAGGDIDFRDPTVDGGLDPGPCKPGEITEDANSWVIQVRCPAAGTSRIRIDLGDREDTVRVEVDVSVAVLGGTGADRLTAAGGADALAGGDGDEVIFGAGGDDQVNGGDGDDEIDGGAGKDIVEAGLGVDSVAGGDGGDDLRVRDGIVDTVRCGAGEDKVDADTLDDVALDCENVSRLPTPVPEHGGGTTGRDRVAPKVRVGGSTVQRGNRVRLLATSSERGTISASGFVNVAGLALPISARSQRVGVGGGVELTAGLNARQRREAARAWTRGRKVTVRLGVVGTDRAGNSVRVAARTIRLLR